MIVNKITDLIGNTPLYEIKMKNNDWKVYLKLEKFNPGGSMKDRMALNMIEQAEKDGRLKPGGTIIESSSGNTAIGLAIASAIKGYNFIAVVDHHASKEKIDMIKAYGGNCGIWFADGVWYIDLSHRVNTKREAMEIGRACNQISVLNWRTMGLAYC